MKAPLTLQAIQNGRDLAVEISGVAFAWNEVPTLECRAWRRRLVRRARIVLFPLVGEGRESFTRRLIEQLQICDGLFELMASVITRQGRAWTFEAAQKHAALLGIVADHHDLEQAGLIIRHLADALIDDGMVGELDEERDTP